MNRKGFVIDYLFFILMFFVVVVGAIVGWFVMSTINDAISANVLIDQDIKDKYDASTQKLQRNFDYTVLTIFILVTVGLIIISYVLPTNPILFFILLIVSTLGIILAGYLSNAFYEISQTSTIGPTVNNFSIASFIMNNYLYLSMFIGLLMSIAYFARPSDVG